MSIKFKIDLPLYIIKTGDQLFNPSNPKDSMGLTIPWAIREKVLYKGSCDCGGIIIEGIYAFGNQRPYPHRLVIPPHCITDSITTKKGNKYKEFICNAH